MTIQQLIYNSIFNFDSSVQPIMETEEVELDEDEKEIERRDNEEQKKAESHEDDDYSVA